MLWYNRSRCRRTQQAAVALSRGSHADVWKIPRTRVWQTHGVGWDRNCCSERTMEAVCRANEQMGMVSFVRVMQHIQDIAELGNITGCIGEGRRSVRHGSTIAKVSDSAIRAGTCLERFTSHLCHAGKAGVRQDLSWQFHASYFLYRIRSQQHDTSS